MKNILLLATSFFAFCQLAAQEVNQVCYLDTSMVEKLVIRTDTSYSLKPQFCTGDWVLYYDFGLGKEYSEFHFDKAGNRSGVWMEWYENGNIKSEWNYKDSWFVAFPIGHSLFPDGKTKIVREVKNDSLVETSYFHGGKLSRIRKWIKTGMLVVETSWYENGQLICCYNPTSATPLPVKKYYANGKLKAEYNWYVYGYTGAYTEYFDNGKISVKGQFQNLPTGANVFMARKIGNWMYYDEKGKVLKTEHWETGRLLKTE